MNRHSKLLEMKNEKKVLICVFFIPKIWEMLKDFSRVFRRAQTQKFWRVDTQDQQYWLSQHSRGMIKNCTTICGPHNVIIPRNKNSNERKEKSVKKTYSSLKKKKIKEYKLLFFKERPCFVYIYFFFFCFTRHGKTIYIFYDTCIYWLQF